MNNFKNYQESRVKSNVQTVALALSKLKKQKRYFKSLTDLALVISDITSIHKNTLLYRLPYKKILFNFYNKLICINNCQELNNKELKNKNVFLISEITLLKEIIQSQKDEIFKLKKIIDFGLKFKTNVQIQHDIEELSKLNSILLNLISNILNNHKDMLVFDAQAKTLLDYSRRQGDPSRNLTTKDDFVLIAKHLNRANPQSLNNISLDIDAIINEKF